MTIKRVELEALFCMHSWHGSIATYLVEYREDLDMEAQHFFVFFFSWDSFAYLHLLNFLS